MNETPIASATAAVAAVGDTTDMSSITTSSGTLDIATGNDEDVEIVRTPLL